MSEQPLTCTQGHVLEWLDKHTSLCDCGVFTWWNYYRCQTNEQVLDVVISALRQARAERDALKSDLEISEQTRRGHHVVMDSQSAEIVQLRAERDAARQKAKDLKFTVESLEMGVRSFRDERDVALADNAALLESIKLFNSYFSECPECGVGGKPHLAHCSMKRVYAQEHPGAPLLAMLNAANAINAHKATWRDDLSSAEKSEWKEMSARLWENLIASVDALRGRKEQKL